MAQTDPAFAGRLPISEAETADDPGFAGGYAEASAD
jgi:hypothetical protein